jgi:hypothetical protein
VDRLPRRTRARRPACLPWSSATTPSPLPLPGRKFIDGEPMKPATKVVCGSSYTCIGVPICSARPAFITTMRSASVIASTWSCVTYRLVV